MKKVQLKLMTKKDYTEYIQTSITNYAAEMQKSGRFDTKEAAEKYAAWEFEDTFKEGFDTKDIYLYNIITNNKKIGTLWFLNEDQHGFPGEGFIGDFQIEKEFRGNGYGTEALHIAAELAREQGLTEMRLGVLKHNTRAKTLYTREGYTIFKEREYDFVMQKILW